MIGLHFVVVGLNQTMNSLNDTL